MINMFLHRTLFIFLFQPNEIIIIILMAIIVLISLITYFLKLNYQFKLYFIQKHWHPKNIDG